MQMADIFKYTFIVIDNIKKMTNDEWDVFIIGVIMMGSFNPTWRARYVGETFLSVRRILLNSSGRVL